MLKTKLLRALAGEAEKLYVDDVFSTHLYIPPAGAGYRTITTGIDYTKGALVWTKNRVNAGVGHELVDTLRGDNNVLSTNTTAAQGGGGYTQSFTNGSFQNYTNSTDGRVYWSFRKALKFFDVVTWTGNGVAGRQIPHTLGVAPGMLVIKSTNVGADWLVWHKNSTGGLFLNTTAADNATASYFWGNGTYSAPTDTTFTIGNDIRQNGTGYTYVAYLFAHDTSTDGMIQCGSFTTDGSGNATVSLGWEPQWLLVKDSAGSGSWKMTDSMRGFTTQINDPALYANTAATESGASNYVPTATGFQCTGEGASAAKVYLAIRRPNKPPTTGTQVYNAITRTGTGGAVTVTGAGFAPDLVLTRRKAVASNHGFFDRLRGRTLRLFSASTNAESTEASSLTGFDTMDGFIAGADPSSATVNSSGAAYVHHLFKRYPGVFDVVCYTGTGSATPVLHGLSVLPEFMIWKSRSASTIWDVWHKDLGIYSSDAYRGVTLNTTAASSNKGTVRTSGLTSTSWTPPAGGETNTASATYVQYLFATKVGISKVGSYTGNGSSQTINCDFTTGARFILIKRTDSTGDWYIWDSARGIVSGNDPHLSFNTTVAEVTTDDSIDPDTSGFIVNQVAATDINVSSAAYIYLAIT